MPHGPITYHILTFSICCHSCDLGGTLYYIYCVLALWHTSYYLSSDFISLWFRLTVKPLRTSSPSPTLHICLACILCVSYVPASLYLSSRELACEFLHPSASTECFKTRSIWHISPSGARRVPAYRTISHSFAYDFSFRYSTQVQSCVVVL